MLFISDETFDKYLKQRYFDNIYPWRVFGAEDIILTSFDSWKYNYEQNPNAWYFVVDDYFYASHNYMYFPYMKTEEKYTNSYKIVKFLTKKDYKKFFRYYRKHIVNKRSA